MNGPCNAHGSLVHSSGPPQAQAARTPSPAARGDRSPTMARRSTPARQRWASFLHLPSPVPQLLLGYARPRGQRGPGLRRGRFRGSKLGRGGPRHTETIRANAANGEPHKNLAAAPRPTTARLLIFNFNAGQGRAGSTPPAAPRCARLRHATYSRAGPRHAQSQASARRSVEPHPSDPVACRSAPAATRPRPLACLRG